MSQSNAFERAPSFEPEPDGAPGRSTASGGAANGGAASSRLIGSGDDEPNAVWLRVRRALQERIRPEQFHTWFEQAELRAIGRDAVELAVQNNFTSFFIKTYYGEQLADALADALGGSRAIEIVVDRDLARGPSQTALHQGGTAHQGGAEQRGAKQDGGLHAGSPVPAPGIALPPTRRPGANEIVPLADAREALDHARRTGSGTAGGAKTPPADTPERGRTDAYQTGYEHPRGRLLSASDVGLNSTYRFETFVVGPCNRFAHAASVGVSEQPGQTYNPLFLHGNVGLGKTHLIQSLCHAILARDPGTRILYLSCESFVNHFVDALDKGDLQQFRNKYRNVDVLVVDDIHLLANKERTQEEFFHTFNTLYNAGKQIVLSSDSPPKDIPTLQSRLVSRFKWGLVTEIEPPCYETRRAILKRKSRERGNELPDDVASDLAEAITANIRELEGAVTRLIGYAALSSQAITVALARECLRDLFEHATAQPTVDDVLRAVTSHFQIRLVDLQSRKRTHAIAFARQVGMYLARKLTRLSLQEIGGHFGGRDHSTVLYAVERIRTGIQKDPEILETVRRIEASLAAR